MKLATACNNKDFSIVDESVTTEDIKKFTEWKISKSPKYTSSNTKTCFKYLYELQNFIKFLEIKPGLDKQEIKKLNDTFSSCCKLKDLIISKIVEQPKIYEYKTGILPKDLIEELVYHELNLAGEI